jgi:hypothetical protein
MQQYCHLKKNSWEQRPQAQWLLYLSPDLTIKNYILPTQYEYGCCTNIRINSNYFPKQHQLSGFLNGDMYVLYNVRTQYIAYFLCVEKIKVDF